MEEGSDISNFCTVIDLRKDPQPKKVYLEKISTIRTLVEEGKIDGNFEECRYLCDRKQNLDAMIWSGQIITISSK